MLISMQKGAAIGSQFSRQDDLPKILWNIDRSPHSSRASYYIRWCPQRLHIREITLNSAPFWCHQLSGLLDFWIMDASMNIYHRIVSLNWWRATDMYLFNNHSAFWRQATVLKTISWVPTTSIDQRSTSLPSRGRTTWRQERKKGPIISPRKTGLSTVAQAKERTSFWEPLAFSPTHAWSIYGLPKKSISIPVYSPTSVSTVKLLDTTPRSSGATPSNWGAVVLQAVMAFTGWFVAMIHQGIITVNLCFWFNIDGSDIWKEVLMESRKQLWSSGVLRSGSMQAQRPE